MTDDTPIPQPFEIAQELVKLKQMPTLTPRDRMYCDIGLMCYWIANEINNLVIILQPNVPLQDETKAVSSESPAQDGEGATGRPMDADAQRQKQGSD